MSAVKKGLAVIAPSAPVPDPEAFERGLNRLAGLGFEIHNLYDHRHRFGRFSATDGERLAAVHEAASLDSVSVVMAARGGYGMSRLMDKIDFARIAKSGKTFIGYSDFTAFNMGLLAAGGTSLTGPSVYDDFTRDDPSDLTIGCFLRALNDEPYDIAFAPDAGNPETDVTGILWGGNLALFSHLAGTPYLPDISGGILFFEDVAEAPYRIERMLIQLKLAGILEKQAAIVLGHFTECGPNKLYPDYTLDTVIAWLRANVSVPVVTGLPFGHVKDKVTLKIGANARLVSSPDTTVLTVNT